MTQYIRFVPPFDWFSEGGDGIRAACRTDKNDLPLISIGQLDCDGRLIGAEDCQWQGADYEIASAKQLPFCLCFFSIIVLAEVGCPGFTLTIFQPEQNDGDQRILAIIKKPWIERAPVILQRPDDRP